MTDADLIYNALLRAEKRLETPYGTFMMTPQLAEQQAAFRALNVLREEIGRGLSSATPVVPPIRDEP
jgi:hypothetical protein